MFVYGSIFPKLAVDLLLAAFGGGLASAVVAWLISAVRALGSGRFSRRNARKAAARWGVMGACLATGVAAVLIGFSMVLHILP